MSTSVHQPLTSQSKSEHNSRALADSLSLCYEKRWVAEWLFNDLTSAVIRKDCLISPGVFDHGMYLSMNVNLPIPGAFSPKVKGVTTIAAVPIGHLENITIGYAFTFVVIKADLFNFAGKDNPFAPPFVARFAFDHRPGGKLLYLTKGGRPRQVGIACLYVAQPFTMERIFSVPFKEYAWNDLPQYPTSVLEGFQEGFNREFACDRFSAFLDRSQPNSRVQDDPGIDNNLPFDKLLSKILYQQETKSFSPSRLEQFQSFTDSMNNSCENNTGQTEDLFSTIFQDTSEHQTHHPIDVSFNETSKSLTVINQALDNIDHTPWMVSEYGHPADGVSRSEIGGSSLTSSGMFDLSQLSDCIRDIEQLMTNGEFFVPAHDTQTLEQLPFLAGLTFETVLSDASTKAIVRDTCRQVYYDIVLSVDVDNPFFTSSSCTELLEIDTVGPISETQTKSVKHRILRGTNACACGSECDYLVARIAKRKKTLEERKIRNRASAALSNERRRVKIQADKEEIKANRRRIEKLQAREEELRRENDALMDHVITFRNDG